MDPNNQLTEGVRKVWESLPPALQQAIESASYKEALAKLVKAHGLHIDQAGALEQEVLFVLMGMTDATDFGQALIKEVGLRPEVADPISKEVQEHVFAPVAKHLSEALHAETAQEEAAYDAAAASATAPTNTPARPVDPYREPID